MNAIVCAIAKNENLYINEWCHHYFNLGFNHIYLYDNNDSNTPFVGDFIDKELLEKITIINVNDNKSLWLQTTCYRECFYKYQFDWVLFCDIDEFLDGVDDINSFLSQDKFKDMEQIKVLWRCFGDNDAIERDINIPVKKFFTKEAKQRTKTLTKCFVKHLPSALINNCHIQQKTFNEPLKTCFPSGKLCRDADLDSMFLEHPEDYANETIYINHYITKSLKEFLDNKYFKDDPLFMHAIKFFESYYWKYNNKTPEKLLYIQKYLKLHNLVYR